MTEPTQSPASATDTLADAARRTAATERRSCPGKVFLVGEYAVLAGLPAWLVTLGPRFWLETRAAEPGAPKGLDPNALGLAAESPAGRLLLSVFSGSSAGAPPRFHFDDPHGGAGGFGASTAQFALLYDALSALSESGLERGWEGAFRYYRRLFEGSALAPSGADLAAQWVGGVARFRPESSARPAHVEPERLGARLWPRVWVFSAAHQTGRKAATHEHLRAISGRGAGTDLRALGEEKLAPLLERMPQILERSDAGELGRLLNDYGDALAASGLELAATAEDRKFFLAQPGVLGAKGTGALQADAIAIVIDPDRFDGEALLDAAERRGLRFQGSADAEEAGVRLESGGVRA